MPGLKIPLQRPTGSPPPSGRRPAPRFAKPLFVVIMLGMLALWLVPALMSSEQYRNTLIAVFKEKTGKTLVVRGAGSLSFFPAPSVTFESIEIPVDSKNPAPSFQIAKMVMHVSWASIFTDRPVISGVDIDNASLEIERDAEGVVQWGWLNTELLHGLTAGGSSSIDLLVTNSKLVYRTVVDSSATAIEGLEMIGSFSAQPNIEGAFRAAGHQFQFTLTPASSENVSAGSIPLAIALQADGMSKATLSGVVDASGDVLKIMGDIAAESSDLLHWFASPAAPEQKTQEEKMLDDITNEAQQKTEDKTTLPAKLKAKWEQVGSEISFNNISFEGLNSAAAGEVKFFWVEHKPTLNIKADFSALAYDPWQQFLFRAFTPKKPINPSFAVNEIQESPIPKAVNVALELKAEKLYYDSQIWQAADANLALVEGAITVNKFNISLPGETQLSLFGVVSHASSKGIRFEGSTDTSGKSLRDLLTVFDDTANQLPETGFGSFAVRSNVFLSSDQVRLSEAEARFDDLRLNGGLVGYFDSAPRLEADVKLKNINFDYFRDVWRERQQGKEQKDSDFFMQFNRGNNFDWLKKLRANIDFKVRVEEFTFMERIGREASFRLFAKRGELGLYNLSFAYPESTTTASFMLNVDGAQPNINLVFNTDIFNTNYFSLDKVAALTPPTQPEVVLMPQSFIISRALAQEAPQPITDTVASPPVIASPPALTPAAAEPMPPVPPTLDVPAVEQPEVPLPVPTPEPPPPTVTEPVAVDPVATSTAVAERVVDEGRWSTKLIDTRWMDGFDGRFDISIGKFVYKDRTIDRVKVQARLERNLLTLQNFTFFYWQGRCAVTGSLYGGKVPGTSLGFTLYNVELQDMLKELLGYSNVKGKASMSGTVTTSGVNMLSWVTQAESKIVVAARGVVVDGVDVQGVVDAMSVSRTAADVLNNVTRVFFSGYTDFSIDGPLNLKNATIVTPAMSVKTGNIVGNLNGDLNLLKWNMRLSTLFQFPALTSETIPTMTVQLQGPVESLQAQTDTSSLEAYVVKRIVGN